MRNIRALLCSLPWADFRFPSSQIGAIAAFARKKGFDVEGRHLHLEVAALFGIGEYATLTHKLKQVPELFFAALLFPDKQKQKMILKYLGKHISNAANKLKRMERGLKRVYRDIDWNRYDVIGFTINFHQIFSSLLISKWLKCDYPDKKIIFGGTRVVGELGKNVLKCFPQVDWCVDGEGELALVKLLEYLSKEIDGFEDKVPGLIYRSKNGVHINPRKQICNLAGLPDPDYDHYFDLLERSPLLRSRGVSPIIPIEGSRGCPHGCAFCSAHVYWKGHRVRPAGDVAKQIKRLSNRYRVNRFQFTDVVVPKGERNSLFALISKQKKDFDVFYEIRADITKPELKIMKRGGVRLVQIGIEAMTTRLLQKMNKGTRVIDNLQVMKFCEELGIEHVSNIILNFPTETQSDIDESIANIEYANAYRPPYTLQDFRMIRGIPVYRNPQNYLVSDIRNEPIFKRLLPRGISEKLMQQVYVFNVKSGRRNHSKLLKRVKKWEKAYDQARLDNQLILSFNDMGEFLLIYDYRQMLGDTAFSYELLNTVKLEREARGLYLFCDSYKSWDEIKKRFPKWDEKEIKKVLNKLVKLKVMFREDDDYLSLAIRANGPR